MALPILFTTLGAFALWFVVAWIRSFRRAETDGEPGTEFAPPKPLHVLVGVVTDFFDTLGIGSFATTTMLFRWLKLVPDRLIPGTMNLGHTLPTILQAFIYITIIKVDPTTLILTIAAAVLGAWCGAGLVASLDRRSVQIGMGSALLCAGGIVLYRQLNQVGNVEGTDGLTGVMLVVGIVGNFVLGVLMTIGVGLYAPCMILVALLGLRSEAAFPIMMGSCAFLMPVASLRFSGKKSYSPRAALGLTLGGLPAVAVAAFWVKSLEVRTVNWVVLVAVAYTAVTMLAAAFRSPQAVAERDAAKD